MSDMLRIPVTNWSKLPSRRPKPDSFGDDYNGRRWGQAKRIQDAVNGCRKAMRAKTGKHEQPRQLP